MADMAILDRVGPLAGRRTASVTPLPPMLRLSLRGDASALAILKPVFGVAPGVEACRAVVSGGRAALWLGPDEWMLAARDAEGSSLFEDLGQALAGVPHSLVDISHRNIGFLVTGTAASDLLAEGCPLDLDLHASPVGFCSRTVLGKCDVVLWRMAPEMFHIECWRSFAPYLSGFMAQAGENL